MQDYELSPETEAVKHRYAGEILFFKTLDYFNKVKRFGDVPWYDKVLVPGDEDLYKGRDSRITVVANMIKDIDQAIEWLPKKENDRCLPHQQRRCTCIKGTYMFI